MLKTQISLLGIILLVAFIETVLVPEVWGTLRCDLFLGMIIGVIIHLGFSQGLLFVMVTSVLLQAFTGARPGLLPLFYLFTFVVLNIIKDIIYLENIMTQLMLAAAFSALGAGALVLFLDISLTSRELAAVTLGTVLTGCASPLMAALVGRVKRAYEG
ncbi:MAG TPA: hypothetical protein PLR71_14670 [Deltaproteobacteria bacterium]|nr:hypothetical protein [Deltaproteobacteria bacterium]HQI82787.1 hypothetical protein [Deltaproteobacteria bacterium]